MKMLINYVEQNSLPYLSTAAAVLYLDMQQFLLAAV